MGKATTTTTTIIAMSLLAFGGCASHAPPAAASSRGEAEDAALTTVGKEKAADRELSLLVHLRKYDLAMQLAEQKEKTGARVERKAGAFWKAVILVHLGREAEAMDILKAHSGRWGSVMRETSAEALRHAIENSAEPCLARPRPDSEARVAAQSGLPSAAQSAIKSAAQTAAHSQNQVQSLEKRTLELQNEVERLEKENLRYEKLLHELDRLD